jgi:hypothetical protein
MSSPQSFVRFIASVTKERVLELYDQLRYKVTERGHWAGIWNEITQEIFVHNYSKDDNVGKKSVLSNAAALTRKDQKHGNKWSHYSRL